MYSMCGFMTFLFLLIAVKCFGSIVRRYINKMYYYYICMYLLLFICFYYVFIHLFMNSCMVY